MNGNQAEDAHADAARNTVVMNGHSGSATGNDEAHDESQTSNGVLANGAEVSKTPAAKRPTSATKIRIASASTTPRANSRCDNDVTTAGSRPSSRCDVITVSANDKSEQSSRPATPAAQPSATTKVLNNKISDFLKNVEDFKVSIKKKDVTK